MKGGVASWPIHRDWKGPRSPGPSPTWRGNYPCGRALSNTHLHTLSLLEKKPGCHVTWSTRRTLASVADGERTRRPAPQQRRGEDGRGEALTGRGMDCQGTRGKRAAGDPRQGCLVGTVTDWPLGWLSRGPPTGHLLSLCHLAVDAGMDELHDE